MNSILIVTSIFDIGGLETHIKGQINELTALGCKVHLATGSQFNSVLVPKSVASVTKNLAFDSNATINEVLYTIETLRQLIRKHKIDIVHAHPFASILLGCIAAEMEGVAFTLTLHGPASLNSLSYFQEFLFKSCLLPNAKLIFGVSEEVEELVTPYLRDKNQISVLSNGIDFSSFKLSVKNQIDHRWLIVSRLDSMKIVGITDFIIKAKQVGLKGVLIVGDGPAKEALQNQLLLDGLGEFVEFLGMRVDVPQLMQTVAGVAGMGRVALEGVASFKPVFLIGYDGVKGVLNPKLFELACKANFSGRNLVTIDVNHFQTQYEYINNDEIKKLYNDVSNEFSESVVWRKFLEKIQIIPPQSSSILSDFYRLLRVNHFPNDSFWSSSVIFDCFGSLIHSMKYFEQNMVASFFYYRDKFIDIRLVQEISERDEKITHLIQEHDFLEKRILENVNKIQALEQSFIQIKSSKSWLLTRPLRFTRIFINNPIVALYQLAKFIYWRLPLPFRQSLHGVKDKVTRQFKGKIVAQSVGDKADLSWDDFAQNVLLNRNNYKGVFVQELVIDWNVPLYQRPQHLATALGRLGYLVIYKTDNWAGDNVNGFREVEKNVWLTNQIHHVDTINGVVRSFYSTAYANTPQTLLKNDKRGMLIYEYIDHIDPQISGDAENIQRLLALKDLACTSDVDFVVASARKLEEEMVSLVGKKKVISIPNGVDTRHYRNPIHKKMPLPDNVVQFRKKYTNIVGYFGALAPWLWYDLINDLVKSRPDLGFVFIGPDYYGGLAKLPKAENVLYLGVVDYKILPAYAHTFDVCFIPFALGEIAKTTSPLKLFEYFALMKPVVVTSDMQECIQFQEVFSGGDVSSISQAIDKAIVIKKDHEFCQKLSNLADQNDWDKRAQELDVVFQALKDGILSENRN